MNLLQTWQTSPDTLLKRLVEYRVKRGIRWLDKHAPENWWARMFRISPDGTWHFLARDCLANACVLALAFQTRSDLASHGSSSYGFVTYATVAKAYGLDIKTGRQLGFNLFGSRIIADHLDATWKDVLSRTLSERIFRPLFHRQIPDVCLRDNEALDLTLLGPGAYNATSYQCWRSGRQATERSFAKIRSSFGSYMRRNTWGKWLPRLV